jgi:hypothetical protein
MFRQPTARFGTFVAALLLGAGPLQAQPLSGEAAEAPGPEHLGGVLLRFEQVRKDLGLSELQGARAAGLLQREREERRKRFSEIRDLPREERQRRMAESRGKLGAELAALLNPEQQQRLEQIVLQMRGAEALADPEVSSRLGLSEAQQAEIGRLLGVVQQKREWLAERAPEERRKETEELREVREQALTQALVVLSDEQRQTFDHMRGAKFELERAPLPERRARRTAPGQSGPAARGSEKRAAPGPE